MEKEKLLDRISNFFKDTNFRNKNVFILVYFLFLLISNIFSKNLFLFIVFITIIHVSWLIYEINVNENKYVKIISQLYLVFSGYSLVYIPTNFNNSGSIYLWISFLIFSIKISEYFLDGIFLDDNDKKFNLIKFSILSIVTIIVGIITSLFMKQRVIMFILVNLFIYVLIKINSLFPERYQENVFLKYYNLVAFPVMFVWLFLTTGIILIK